MPNGSNKRVVGIDILKKRIADAREGLKDIEAKIALLEVERDADLQGCKTEQTTAQVTAEMAQAVRVKLLDEAASTRETAKQLLAAARNCEEQADAVDLKQSEVLAAERKLMERKEHWRKELLKIQDGSVRRRRSALAHDIERLELRLERKALLPPIVNGTVPVVPAGIGTSAQPGAVEEKNDAESADR